ncbi:non-specific serine/threonine protein kinase [Entamoeba marina]
MGNTNRKAEKKDKKKDKQLRKSTKTKNDNGNEKTNTAEDKNVDTTNVKEEKQEDEEIDSNYIELYNSSKKKITQDDFELLKVIGRGSFGKVMMVKKKDDEKIFAMKVLRKDIVKERKQVDHTKAEKQVLQHLSHPFIVKLHYAFQTSNKLYMVMDFINGGELFYHLKNENSFSEERAKYYAAEIALVLIHIHDLGVIYRDLKPENILLDSTGNVVITDFGLSKQLAEGENTQTFCGTPDYLAPEILKGVGHGPAVDWWSLGILIYEMIIGIPPFYDDDVSLMYQKILKSQPHFPRNISYDAKSVVMGLLEKDPAERLCGEDVIKMSWFDNIDFDLLKKKELTPPWVPPVSSKTETTQIDEEFVQEEAVDTPPLIGENGDNTTFEGFTFVQTAALEDDQ